MVRVSRVLGEVLGWDDRLVVLLVLLVHMHVVVIARLGADQNLRIQHRNQQSMSIFY
jgi:hypothetical protein